MNRRQPWAYTVSIAYLKRTFGKQRHPNKAAAIMRRYESQINLIAQQAKAAEHLINAVEFAGAL